MARWPEIAGAAVGVGIFACGSFYAFEAIYYSLIGNEEMARQLCGNVFIGLIVVASLIWVADRSRAHR